MPPERGRHRRLWWKSHIRHSYDMIWYARWNINLGKVGWWSDVQGTSLKRRSVTLAGLRQNCSALQPKEKAGVYFKWRNNIKCEKPLAKGSRWHHMIDCMVRWKSPRTPLPQGLRGMKVARCSIRPSGLERLLKLLFFLFQNFLRKQRRIFYTRCETKIY